MKNTKLNYMMVGAFVIAMVVVLIVAVAALAGRTGASDTYYTAYSNVSGIKYGTRVLYEGFLIGQVEDVTPDRSSGQLMFKIEMSVKEKWPIPEGSIAQVSATGLLAAISIDIKAGKGPGKYKPGDDIVGGPLVDMMSAFKDIAGEVGDLNQQGLRPLLMSMNKYVEELGAILTEVAPELLANILNLSKDLADKGPVITDNLTEFSGNFADLSRDLKVTKKQLDGVLTDIDSLVGGNQKNVDQSLADLQHTLKAVARHIDSITYNLEGTTRNVHEFSRQIRQNPGVILSGQKTADDAAKK